MSTSSSKIGRGVKRRTKADSTANAWEQLNRDIIACERCSRLRTHCMQIAQAKRKAFQAWDYWGKPVPNLGQPSARLLIVGLAPAAHGANRTGRLFTGDRSGDWLFRALHRAGFANQPHATDIRDGLELIDCAITGLAHCAPPDNKPTTVELEECGRWLHQTLELSAAQVFVVLGGMAWREMLAHARRQEWTTRRGVTFGHGAELQLDDGRLLIGSYHPSQQNTFTGKLTEPMLDDIFRRAGEVLRSR